jgi:hypothetical protein
VIVRREGERDLFRLELRIAQADELVVLVREIGLGASGSSLLVFLNCVYLFSAGLFADKPLWLNPS